LGLRVLPIQPNESGMELSGFKLQRSSSHSPNWMFGKSGGYRTQKVK